MKILATADLHIDYTKSDQVIFLRKLVKREQPDALVIAGDVHDCRTLNPFKDLEHISKDITIIFCLGNHEFAYRSIADTHRYYKSFDRPSNVHCLDICGFVDVQGVRFVGNVLWYDGSLSNRSDVNYWLKNIDPNWLDSSIKNFDPIAENKNCIKQIKDSLKDHKGPSVLLTHTVPHYKLNRFWESNPSSVYNTYSGVHNLFKDHDVSVDIAVCGHTHKPATLYYDNKTECTNIGNDYYFKSGSLVYDVLEI